MPAQPNIYRSFLEILQTYQRESIPIQDLYKQVDQLLGPSLDLIEEFKQLIPEAAAQAVAKRVTKDSAGLSSPAMTSRPLLMEKRSPEDAAKQHPNRDIDYLAKLVSVHTTNPFGMPPRKWYCWHCKFGPMDTTIDDHCNCCHRLKVEDARLSDRNPAEHTVEPQVTESSAETGASSSIRPPM